MTRRVVVKRRRAQLDDTTIPAPLLPRDHERSGLTGAGPTPAAKVLELVPTPAHLAYRVSRGTWAYPKFLQYLNDELTDWLMSPEETFCAVEAPVRHGKSLFCSVHLAAWVIGMYPETSIMHMSYSQDLSKGFVTAVRDIIAEFGPELFGITIAKGHRSGTNWRVARIDPDTGDQGPPLGGMRSVTQGRTITGTGADLIIIDDPIKNAREADSALERDRLWDWYTRVLRNRLEPGGRILLVMARWHEDDLNGRLFDASYVPEGADRWFRIHLPAIAEPAPWEVDDTGQLYDGRTLDDWRDPIGRRFGEPLWPERYSLNRLMKLQASVGPRGWLSNFQQRPTGKTGGLFPKEKWKFVAAVPIRELLLLRYWDLAGSVSGDWTAGVLLGMDRRGLTYILDVARTRGEPNHVTEYVTMIADQDRLTYGRGEVHHIVEQEPGSGGKFQAHAFVSGPLAQDSAEVKPATGSKVVMAGPFSGQLGAGNVAILGIVREDGELGRPLWYPAFAEEAQEFPFGRHDDMIDAASKAYVWLRERWEKRKKRKSKATTAAGKTLL